MVSGAAFRILGVFHDSDVRNFVELCERAGYPTDLGGYYLRQLVKGGYLQKLDRGQYGLLPKGKQELALNYGRQLLAPRPRVGILVIAQQQNKIIVLRRAVQPFVNAAEWPAGMVHMGERLEDAAARLANARLGYTPNLTHIGFFRRIDMFEDSVFDDKLFAVHVAMIPDEVSLQIKNETGSLIRCSESELPTIEQPAKSLLDIFRFSQAGGGFEERNYTLTLDDFTN